MNEQTFPIKYTVQVLPNQHLFQVKLHIKSPNPAGQVLTLPNWIPGSYMIRDFSKNITQIKAKSLGKNISLHKQDKSTWRCDPVTSTLDIEYEVYAWDLSVRGAHTDHTHAFFNATSLCLSIDGFENQAHVLEILPPLEKKCADWKVATTLPRLNAKKYGFGTYQAENYAELIDHPVEMGTFQLAKFEACDIPHEIAFTGIVHADTKRICADLKKICEQQLKFFGKPYPIKKYLFLVHVLGDGYGGLEHQNSCALHCSRRDLPTEMSDNSISDDYHNFLTLCSHEYFHLWNVKRIKPQVFLPYDLTKETHTSLLWVFEGFTRYYEDIHVVRSGVVNLEQFLNNFSKLLSVLQKTPGRLIQSAADSSFDAWTKLYKADENASNAIISYYTKGAVVACALDLTIRLKTENKKSLDDVMQLLWDKFGDQASGLKEGQIEILINELIGVDLTKQYKKWVYGCDEIDLSDLLQEFAIKYSRRVAKSQTDIGGSNIDVKTRADLGIRGTHTSSGLEVKVVLKDSSAQKTGISPGDRLIAFDGIEVKQDWEKQIAEFAIGSKIDIHLFRRDELYVLSTTLQESPANIIVLTPDDSNKKLIQNRKYWLGV